MKKYFLGSLLFFIMFLLPSSGFLEEKVQQLKEQILEIQNQGELGFRQFILCQSIVGYGQYVPQKDNKVKQGGELLFYYEPLNLFTEKKNGKYHIVYTQDIVLYTGEGKELYKAPEQLKFDYNSNSPVMDLYATNSLKLGQLGPGMYRFEAVLHDKLKKATAKYVFKFEIMK
jgi:hypothetical protein